MSKSDHWTGKGRAASWFGGHNWTNGVPGAGAAVFFNDGGDWTVNLAARHGEAARALSMAVDADNLTLTGGSLDLGAHANSPDLTVDDAGALTIDAGASVKTHVGAVIGSLDDMNDTTTAGAITIGGTLATASMNDITGTITVQPGGVLDVGGAVILTSLDDDEAGAAVGTLDIEGRVTSGMMTGAGTIALSGPSAMLRSAGLQSDGDLIVANGASASITEVQLGSVQSSRFGAVTVEGTGSILRANVIEDGGFENNAALTVQDGGRVTASVIDFNTYLTDNDFNIIGTGSSVDVGTLAIGFISNSASLSVTERASLSIGAGGLTLELCPLLLDPSALVATPFIDSLAGTIEAVAGAGSLVTIGVPVMLGVPAQTDIGQSVFMSANGVALDVAGAITGASGTTLASVGNITLSHGANRLPAVEIESGTLVLTALGAAGSGVIQFANSDGAACALQFDPDASLPNILSDFGHGDSIDLQGFAFTMDSMQGFSDGTLTLANGADSVQLVFAGSYTIKDFLVQADAHGGTLIKFQG